MRSVLDLNYEGRHIKLWPDNSVEKWAKICHIREQGIVIEFTKIKDNGYHSHYKVGDTMFLDWTSVGAFILTKEE